VGLKLRKEGLRSRRLVICARRAVHTPAVQRHVLGGEGQHRHSGEREGSGSSIKSGTGRVGGGGPGGKDQNREVAEGDGTPGWAFGWQRGRKTQSVVVDGLARGIGRNPNWGPEPWPNADIG
jgi:hypothetical protein